MRPVRFEPFHIEPFYIENVLGRAKIFNIPIGGTQNPHIIIKSFESVSVLLKPKLPCLLYCIVWWYITAEVGVLALVKL